MRYIGTRLAQAILTMVGALTILFLIVRLTPGDPAYIMLGDYATPELVTVIRERYGLDKPLPVQYLIYVTNFATGNFGVSFSRNLDVGTLVAGAWPYTAGLAIASIIVTCLVGLPLGIVAALKRNTVADVASMMIALLGVAAPGFLLALMLIYALSYHLGMFPVRGAGESGDWLSQLHALTLPALALGFNSAALTARTTRSALLGVLGEDFLRTARAKGLGPWPLLWGHAIRNALIPVLAVLGLQFGQLLGGAGVIELVFGRPGLGRLLIDAILSRDYPLSQALISVLLAGVIVVNLLTDILYGFVDPRVRHD